LEFILYDISPDSADDALIFLIFFSRKLDAIWGIWQDCLFPQIASTSLKFIQLLTLNCAARLFCVRTSDRLKAGFVLILFYLADLPMLAFWPNSVIFFISP